MTAAARRRGGRPRPRSPQLARCHPHGTAHPHPCGVTLAALAVLVAALWASGHATSAPSRLLNPRADRAARTTSCSPRGCSSSRSRDTRVLPPWARRSAIRAPRSHGPSRSRWASPWSCTRRWASWRSRPQARRCWPDRRLRWPTPSDSTGWVEYRGGSRKPRRTAALIVGIGRTSLAMARERDLSRWLAAVHSLHRVPHRAELALVAVVSVLVLTPDLRGVFGFSSFGVLVYYAAASASAVTQPAADRRWARAQRPGRWRVPAARRGAPLAVSRGRRRDVRDQAGRARRRPPAAAARGRLKQSGARRRPLVSATQVHRRGVGEELLRCSALLLWSVTGFLRSSERDVRVRAG